MRHVHIQHSSIAWPVCKSSIGMPLWLQKVWLCLVDTLQNWLAEAVSRQQHGHAL